MFKLIIENAKFSSMTILLKILNQLETNHLPGQEKILSIEFDCSWSYFQNTHQTNEKFLYLGDFFSKLKKNF